MNNEISKEKGCVYFFRHIGLEPVKIGYSSSESPIERFKSFSTYAPFGSEILGFIVTETAKELETILHQKFSNKRLKGEWFMINDEDVKTQIDLYTSIEEKKNKNDFYLEYSKYIQNYKKTPQIKVEVSKNARIHEYFVKYYNENPNMNRTHLAQKLGVSRQTIVTWINKYKKFANN